MPLEALQNGRYRRLRLLGGGGMGEVFLMEDTRINRQVAIKVMRAETGPYPDSETAREAARLFQREARAVATLDHPNILPLHDFGEEPLNGATLTYIVMPYCPEGSFADWLRQRSNTTLLSLQDVASFISQAADALQYAHDRQIIHLDVKASNFLMRSNSKDPTHPTLRLADFGVARMSAATTSSSHTVRGTPTSMAPEHWSSAPVAATDQYALAVMAYELLVGRPPFLGGMEQLMFQHFQAQAPAPSSFNPRLTGAVDVVLLRALAKRPQDRFPSISAFADALEQAVKSFPTETVLRPAEPSPSDIRATLAISKTEAVAGTNRTLTLPGGRRVSVSVPPGAYDGQVIRLPNLGDPTSAESSTGTLVLVLAIHQVDPVTNAPNAESALQTMRASNPNLTPPFTPISKPGIQQTTLPPWQNPPPGSYAYPPTTLASTPSTPLPAVLASNPNLPPIIAPPPPPPGLVFPSVSRQTAVVRPSRMNGRTMLLIGLVLLVIVGSVSLFSVIRANQVPSNATGTTTAYPLTRPHPVISVTSQYHVGSTPAGSNSTTFHISGQKFSANSAITFLLDGAPVPGEAMVQSDTNGTVSADLTVTGAWTIGNHTLTARDASNYTTQSEITVMVCPQGECNTPGPHDAPPDTMSFYLAINVQRYASTNHQQLSSLQQTLVITGQPDPAGGTACESRNTRIYTGNFGNISYVRTDTFTCGGNYKGGQLSYTETATSMKYVLSNGLVCTLQGPFVLEHLKGTFSSANTISGSYTSDGVRIPCSDNTTTVNIPPEGGNWSGQTQ